MSILLCLVLMLSLVPAAYADNSPSDDDINELLRKLEALMFQKRDEGKFEDYLALNAAMEAMFMAGPGEMAGAYKEALKVYNQYSGASGDVIDLYPAYEARQNLYASLGILAEAHFYKNAITGIRAMENKDNREAHESGPVAKLIEALNTMERDPANRSGDSYYGLAKKVAPTVVAANNMAGNILVGTVADKIAGNTGDSMVGGVMTQVTSIVGSFA